MPDGDAGLKNKLQAAVSLGRQLEILGIPYCVIGGVAVQRCGESPDLPRLSSLATALCHSNTSTSGNARLACPQRSLSALPSDHFNS
jgi:hypothetical protein